MPLPKQDAFLRAETFEAFYGGAAGPGKSVALLMGALQYADVPGYAALLIRRTYQDLALPGALMPMAMEWLAGSDAMWNGQTHTWKFPGPGLAGSGGASLTFGYLNHSDDKYRYKSAEFQYVGFDELTEIAEDDYLYLFSRIRGSQSRTAKAPDGLTLADVPRRARGASNPGGPGHDWVSLRFIDEKTRASDVTYVPALIDENPHLDAEAYARRLAMLPTVDRLRLLRGDWDVIEEGDVFNTSLIWLCEDWAEPVSIVRYWDLAATEPNERNRDPDWTVGTRLERGIDNYFTVTQVMRERVGPGEVKNLVKRTSEADGFHVQVFIEQEPGAAGKNLIHEYALELPGRIVRPGLTGSGDKRTRAVPAASAFENRVLRINRYLPNLREVVNELRRFPNGSHDDIVDTISGGYNALTAGGAQSVTSVTVPGDVASATQAGGALPESVAEMMLNRRGPGGVG